MYRCSARHGARAIGARARAEPLVYPGRWMGIPFFFFLCFSAGPGVGDGSRRTRVCDSAVGGGQVHALLLAEERSSMQFDQSMT